MFRKVVCTGRIMMYRRPFVLKMGLQVWLRFLQPILKSLEMPTGAPRSLPDLERALSFGIVK